MAEKKKRRSIIDDIINYPEPTEDDYIKNYKKFFLKAINYPKYSNNGCIFFGSTKVNKIELTHEIMENYNLKEWNGKQGDFVFIDSMKQNTNYKAALKLAEKYKDLKFVIVTNCTNIFHNDDLVLLYKIICDDDRTISVLHKQPTYNIKISAYYVFLDDNDMTADLEYPEKAESFISCTEYINGKINF